MSNALLMHSYKISRYSNSPRVAGRFRMNFSIKRSQALSAPFEATEAMRFEFNCFCCGSWLRLRANDLPLLAFVALPVY